MPPEQPSGTVTLVFSDIEGSTRLLHELGTEAYRQALAEHRRIVREAYARYAGYEVDYEGDAFFYAFSSAPDAVAAVSEAMAGLEQGPISIRVGIHTGSPALDPPKYVGMDVHTAARIMSSGHGGQVVVSPSTAKLVDIELTELGEHRLKDITEPVALYQLGDGSFPPLKTISNTNLPRPASSFLGREAELREVIARIEQGARLVTLTGTGGTGKTRLAIEAASSLVGDYKAGVFWVGLASLRDPALVTETISQVLGAKDGLAAYIQERELLLLLDNLEQVIDAASSLSELLQACPNLTLLVTSRELLRLSGEVEYPVPPLAEPEAVSLFCARSQLEPSDEIAELCARLDSLPLAVELAAARTKALSPAQILERVSSHIDLLKGSRDADPRQQTLRATIDWSYDLLTPEERQLFVRLSVFAGGCTLDAAEEVCTADLDILQALVEKSLLRFSTERYWMLETIRQYASGRLEGSGDGGALRRRHAEFFLALAEEAEPHLFSERSGEWLELLERELDNIRAALDLFEESAQTDRAVRMAGALGEFWTVKGHLGEGRRRVERALAADTSPTAARAKALNAAADMANGSGDRATARLRAEEGLALNRALGRAWGAADSLLVLGIAIMGEGDFVRARELIDESVSLFRELGDERNTLEATRFLASTYGELGDLHEARALLERNVSQAHQLGDNQVEARSLHALAGYALDDGRVEDAFGMLEDAYRVNRESGDLYWTPFIVCRFGHALADAGKARSAAVVLSCGDALLEDLGVGEAWILRSNEARLAVIHTQLDDDAFAKAWEQGRSLTADQAVALALASLD